jgi:integrase/recombinase XerD
VAPFSEDDIRKILTACDYTKEFKRENTKTYKLKRKTAIRDRALIMILLDTGIRVGELTRLKIEDVDLTTGACLIAPYETGRKTKPRTVYLGKASRRTLWLYLAKRDDYRQDDPLIPLGTDPIRLLLKGIEERSGVKNIHPHRFRHTFAIQYLRNKGDVFTLQRLLGHATLSMVQHYLALVDADSADTHRRASPVDNMKL